MSLYHNICTCLHLGVTFHFKNITLLFVYIFVNLQLLIL